MSHEPLTLDEQLPDGNCSNPNLRLRGAWSSCFLDRSEKRHPGIKDEFPPKKTERPERGHVVVVNIPMSTPREAHLCKRCSGH